MHYINLFLQPYKAATMISIYRRGNRGSESVTNVPKVIELVSCGGRLGYSLHLTPKLIFLSHSATHHTYTSTHTDIGIQAPISADVCSHTGSRHSRVTQKQTLEQGAMFTCMLRAQGLSPGRWAALHPSPHSGLRL